MAEWEEWSEEELVAAIARLDKESEELTDAAAESRAEHPAGLPSLVILAQRGRAYEILAAIEAEMERRGRVAAVAGERVEKSEGAG